MKRALWTLAVVAAAAAPLQTFAQDKVIRVGVLMPISGPASYFGVMGKEGIDLALEQLKAGVNGYRLQVQYED
jgi:ABC-type branched-subunit amino acid transport system substrate-binding protein